MLRMMVAASLGHQAREQPKESSFRRAQLNISCVVGLFGSSKLVSVAGHSKTEPAATEQ